MSTYLVDDKIEVVLCTTSSLKTEAVESWLYGLPFEYELTNYNCDHLGLPEQPVDCEKECALERLFSYLDNHSHTDTNDKMVIAIENGLSQGYCVDYCHVVLWYKDTISHSCKGLDVEKIYQQLSDKLGSIRSYSNNIEGHDITLGSLVAELDPSKDSKNWGRRDRKLIIRDRLNSVYRQMYDKMIKINNLKELYKTYPDFPKPGVVFEDIFAVMADPYGLETLNEVLLDRYSHLIDKIDYVVGLESRGFFGVLLAASLGCGFVPIRKAGKLPGEVEGIEYGTEYSQDKCEISKDLPEGSRVIIFDDLVATGGSLKAAIDLVEKVGSVVIDCCVLREVVGLRSKAAAMLKRRYTVVIQ